MLKLKEEIDRKVVRRRLHGGRRTDECPDEALDKRLVAELPASAIRTMSRVELIRVIGAVQFLLPQPEMVDRLSRRDHPTLERMAFLARRSCRNQGY